MVLFVNLSYTRCDSIITTNLTITNAITTSQNIILCNGNNYTLPSGTVVSASGIYKDTINTTSGCDSIITTNLSVLPTSSSNQNYNICAGEGLLLPNGTTVYTSGVYKDTIAAFNGCDSIITSNVVVNTSPVVGVSIDVTINVGQTTTLTATGGGMYNWYPSAGVDNITNNIVIVSPTQTTIYCVVVTNTSGCKDTACVTVKITDLPCPTNENLQIPNAFSPNKDNVNDDFCLNGWDACIVDFEITIFDRWGERVFESKDPNFCWDGVYKNNVMDAQVFVYYVKAKYSNEYKALVKKGNISLIR